MIRIEIEGDAASVLAEMQALIRGIGGFSAPAETPVADTAEVVKPTRKPKAEKPSPEKEEAPKSTAAPAAETGDTETSTATSADVDHTDKAAVKAFVNSAFGNLGGDRIAQVFGEFGATKFGEIPEEKWKALVIRLDDLLHPETEEA